MGIRLTIGRDSRNKHYLTSLLLLSLLFYGWHAPHYIILILISGVTDYVAARAIFSTDARQALRRRFFLILSLFINLSLLGYFKYAGFIVGTLTDFGIVSLSDDLRFSFADILLPIGISFYTFQSMSYTIDVYHGRLVPESRLSRFMLYVGFFPQLVAGPIVRAGDFLYQLNRRRRPCLPVFLEGCYLILRGFFFKIVIADNIGTVVDQHWADAASPNSDGVITVYLAVLFSCQIFCDFKGYTDIARGVAYQLGFRLPENFNAPYIATTFSGFWRRWHITLSEWMRDYVYISFGGNQKGSFFTYLNLMAVMLISGLWHGAAMNFFLWGFIHGIAICIERLLKITEKSQTLVLVGWGLIVQITWIVGMAVFRSQSGDESLMVLENLILGILTFTQTYPVDYEHLRGALWLTIPVWALHLRVFLSERNWLGRANKYERSFYAGIMLIALLTLYPTTLGFIYFQF